PEKACPGLDPGWGHFSEKIMLHQQARAGCRIEEKSSRSSTDFGRILIQAARSRVPGVAQHEVMRCRPGTAQVAEFRAVAHLLSSTSCCTACGTRQRITRRRFQVPVPTFVEY